MICGSGGSKSRLAKAAGAEPAGQMRDENLHAVVARSTFRSQNVQSTPGSDHFWKLRCPKSVGRCGAKHIWKSKCTKHTRFGPLLEVDMSKKRTPLRREAHVEVKMHKNTPGSDHFWAFRLAGTVQEACSSEMLGGQGADFLRGVAFWSMRSSSLLRLRWFCVTGAALRMTWHHFAVAGAILQRHGLERMWKIAKRIGTRLSDLHSTFHYWRKSRRIASFLMLPTSKIEEVSQTCFVFDVANLKKLRKSCRIASFLTLSSSKVEDVSRNSFVFKLADRQIDR